jgi:uncharacterized protein
MAGQPESRDGRTGHVVLARPDCMPASFAARRVNMASAVTLHDLRRYAVARTLFAPTSLRLAIDRLGFVQADPIRAPARAQDLTLRHRVTNYRVGDLERKYPSLPVEEDYFVNYGFLPRRYQVLMHPRVARKAWGAATKKRALAVLDFVRERGSAHPREVDEHFAHGSVTNYWGGSTNATTHLLDAMHYRGLLRVLRRERGVRIYAPHEHERAPVGIAVRRERLDLLVDLVVHKYAPLPGATLRSLVRYLRYGVPQMTRDLDKAFTRAEERSAHACIDGVDWYWPEGERPEAYRDSVDDRVRLLAPFDPIVWDRHRFELLWGWPYRFEAYVPAPKRKFGYYALPLLWRDRVIGWGNLSVKDGLLDSALGYASRVPRARAFRTGLDDELDRMWSFLRL